MARRRRRTRNSPGKSSHTPGGRPHGARRIVLAAVAVVVLSGVLATAYLVREQRPAGLLLKHAVVNTFPHDPAAFTQGLAYHDGFIYEGTGQYGQSTLRRTELETGAILQSQALSRLHFGEGIALDDDRIVQLTYKSGVGFVRDRKTFRVLREFRYAGEGWGLTYDGEHFIMSDGSATLRLLDPKTFAVTSSLTVTNGGKPVRKLNELEMVRGEIYANIWQSDWIARISPRSGKVTGWIDLSDLRVEARKRVRRGAKFDVLNGIAYDEQSDRLFVTGKLWPVMFEIRVTEP